MIHVDWTQVDAPPLRLFVDMSGGGYVVRDQHGVTYTLAPLTLTAALRFMQAMERRKDAVIDDASVEMATWSAAQHSVRVGALDAGETVPPSWDVADGTSPASNVVPIRRLA